VTAGVVYLPMKDKLYAAARGHGATLNGDPIRCPSRTDVERRPRRSSHVPTYSLSLEGRRAAVRRAYRPSIAYRLALVAEGRFDLMLTFRDTWEWDIAAGAILIAEAGGTVSDASGARIAFNKEADGARDRGRAGTTAPVAAALQARWLNDEGGRRALPSARESDGAGPSPTRSPSPSPAAGRPRAEGLPETSSVLPHLNSRGFRRGLLTSPPSGNRVNEVSTVPLTPRARGGLTATRQSRRLRRANVRGCAPQYGAWGKGSDGKLFGARPLPGLVRTWRAVLRQSQAAGAAEGGQGRPDRIAERRGEASKDRPEGDLIWFHAASVGESLALLWN
jgi:hypothetical protein